MACATFDLSALGASLGPCRSSSYAPNPSPSLGALPKRRALMVTMMAKREMLMQEIREMSDEQINEKVIDMKGEMYLMRCKKVTRQEYNVYEYVSTKKKVARMLTVKRERELEKGIKPRESRKLKKQWKRSIEIRPPPSLVPILAEQEKERQEKLAKEAK